MRKLRQNSDVFGGETFAAEMRGQPRKSFFERQKNIMSHSSAVDDDEHWHHHTHRNEPAKNAVRVQLRRIEKLF